MVIPRRELASASDAYPLIGIGGSRLVTGCETGALRRDPAAVSAAAAWHQATRHPLAVGMDSAIGLGAFAAATGSPALAGEWAACFAATGLLFGLWKRRTSLEAQGVAWVFRPLVFAGAAAGLAAAAVGDVADSARGTLVAVVALVVARSLLWACLGSARRRGYGLRRTLVIGLDHRAALIRHRMRTFPEAGLRFESAYVPGKRDGFGADRQVIERLVGSPAIEHVMCSIYDVDESVLKGLLEMADRRVDVSLALPLPSLGSSQTRAHIGDLALIPIRREASWGSGIAKRVFDILGAVLLTAVASPVLLLTALAIRLGDPGPAIFKQRRVGRGGRTFVIYKFRSMVRDAEARREEYLSRNVNWGLLFKVESDPRITRVGSVIRRFSIDELPQLFNVIKGDMSLVGPRPLPVQPEEFDATAQIRHHVLPGITGLWQVKGANALSYADMIDLDLTYVATRSFGLDLTILLRTLPAVLIRRCAY